MEYLYEENFDEQIIYRPFGNYFWQFGFIFTIIRIENHTSSYELLPYTSIFLWFIAIYSTIFTYKYLFFSGLFTGVAGIYIGEMDDAPGAALIGILLMMVLFTLGARTVWRRR